MLVDFYSTSLKYYNDKTIDFFPQFSDVAIGLKIHHHY